MILLLLACWEPATPAPPAEDVTVPPPALSMTSVKQAASIANAIQREPERADLILQNNGMTREQLDDLLFEIAIDPPKSQAYAKFRAQPPDP